MPESKEDEDKRALRELEGKKVAQYSVLLQAWIDTKMERDKTLVTLSAAAVGLLVTILTTVGVPYLWVTLLYIVSFSGFLTTILASLKIYQRNSKHIEDALRGKSGKDPLLKKFDRLSVGSFIVASVFTISIGLVSASSHFNNAGVNQMSQKVQSSGETRSLNGIGDLNPNSTQGGSGEQGQGAGNSGSGSDNSGNANQSTQQDN